MPDIYDDWLAESDGTDILAADQNPFNLGGLLGSVVTGGLGILGAWGTAQVTKDDKENQIKLAEEKSNTTLYVVGGIAGVAVLFVLIWLMRRRA
jgi:hypothetical protein